jgi:hypothetical protein
MITYVVGPIGCGKSCYAAEQSQKAIKAGRKVYSMTPIKGAYIVTKEDIGKYELKDALVIIDESGIIYGSREWKLLDKGVIEWYKTSRHDGCDVIILSQESNDTDSKIRGLATKMLLIRPLFSVTRKSKNKQKYTSTIIAYIKTVKIEVDIDPLTHDEPKALYYKKRSVEFLFNFRWWKYFDSFYSIKRPQKNWELW